MLSDAVLGAFIGAFATIGTQGIASVVGWRTARSDQAQQLKATALLVQDDFLHYQAVIVRSLDRGSWWRPSELLASQSTVADRRAIWVELGDANEFVAAQAQGWMDVLIAQRASLPRYDKNGDAPSLDGQAADIMRTTFCDLEGSRSNLADLAGRTYVPFAEGQVLIRLKRPGTTLSDLGLDCAAPRPESR